MLVGWSGGAASSVPNPLISMQIMEEERARPKSLSLPHGCQGEGEEEEEGEEGEEEELSVLPRHTKVVVTGNNRTKPMLVGLHGVVKKAVGLGGWHWLVLTNGIEVKLQRNALSVIEAPTGQEEDEDDSDTHMPCKPNLESPKPFKSRVRLQKPGATSKVSRKLQASVLPSMTMDSSPHGVMKVDFRKLETSTLMRYWRHFNLMDPHPSPTKEQLVDAVGKHFMGQKLDELHVISSFVQATKRLKTVYA